MKTGAWCDGKFGHMQVIPKRERTARIESCLKAILPLMMIPFVFDATWSASVSPWLTDFFSSRTDMILVSNDRDTNDPKRRNGP